MDRMPRAPGYVRWVTKTLEEEGYETWAVGGAIRNALLDLPSGDWDLATRAPPKIVQGLFPRTVPIGLEHGTVGVLTREGTLLEVTTFRRDVETFGRRAVVEFADTLLEDLSRRDFTVNAIAWHPLREEFQDPFQGGEDLEARLLRTVGDPRERFAEDYLRVLRGLRFSGRFRFRIQEETWAALCDADQHLLRLSPERIREELMKSLSGSPRPSGVLALYGASGVLEVLYPELASMVGCQRPRREEDLWVHSLLLMDTVPSSRPLLRLLALLHGVGVPDDSSGQVGDPGSRGRDRAAAMMIRLRFSNAETRDLTELIRMGPEAPVELTASPDLRSWLHRADPDRVPNLARIWLGKARLDAARWNRDPGPTTELIRRLRRELRTRPPLRMEELALDGRDLIAMGLRPGPRFGEILDALLERVLEDPSLNQRERLMALVEEELAGEE
jgi:tRNA nucleotidyltransferase (CCA-adding enzyme)